VSKALRDIFVGFYKTEHFPVLIKVDVAYLSSKQLDRQKKSQSSIVNYQVQNAMRKTFSDCSIHKASGYQFIVKSHYLSNRIAAKLLLSNM
jgi:hypothetical protein